MHTHASLTRHFCLERVEKFQRLLTQVARTSLRTKLHEELVSDMYM